LSHRRCPKGGKWCNYNGLTVVVLELSNFLFSLVFLFFLNWQLALLSLIGLTLCTIAPAKIASLATEVGYKLLQKEGQIASVVEENILSQTVVKIFGLENQMIPLLQKYATIRLKRARMIV
jgi:ATP-binding cassette subfamily B protein